MISTIIRMILRDDIVYSKLGKKEKASFTYGGCCIPNNPPPPKIRGNYPYTVSRETANFLVAFYLEGDGVKSSKIYKASLFYFRTSYAERGLKFCATGFL